jgi:hypothetical protein
MVEMSHRLWSLGFTFMYIYHLISIDLQLSRLDNSYTLQSLQYYFYIYILYPTIYILYPIIYILYPTIYIYIYLSIYILILLKFNLRLKSISRPKSSIYKKISEATT